MTCFKQKHFCHNPVWWHELFIGMAFAFAVTLIPSDVTAACPEVTDADFRLVKLATGMTESLQMSIDKDNRIFIATKRGEVRLIKPGVAGSALVGKLAVMSPGYMGLLSIVLDRAFPTKPWIYLLYNPNKPFSNFRVSRFDFKGDSLEMNSEKIILEIPNKDIKQAPEGTHTGAKLAFGPEGLLYITSGDNAQFGDYGQLDERSELGTSLFTSGNTNSLNGKLLRIQLKDDGTYTIPAGNLFPPGTALTRPEIFAMGLRNPYSIHIDKRNGWILIGDVGPQGPGQVSPRGPPGGEEWLVIQKPGNYGWPMFYGMNEPYAHFDYATGTLGSKFDPAVPVNDSKWNTGLKVLPPALPSLITLAKFKTDPTSIGFNTTSHVCLAGPLYRYEMSNPSKTKLPPQLNGKWFLGEYIEGRIRYVTLDKTGRTFQPNRRLFSNLKLGKPMDMRLGPDGNLNILDFGGEGSIGAARVFRIEYSGLEHSPAECGIPMGCTDVSKSNYNAAAEIDDGSCVVTAAGTKQAVPADRISLRGGNLWVEHTGAYQVVIHRVDGSVVLHENGTGSRGFLIAPTMNKGVLLVSLKVDGQVVSHKVLTVSL